MTDRQSGALPAWAAERVVIANMERALLNHPSLKVYPHGAPGEVCLQVAFGGDPVVEYIRADVHAAALAASETAREQVERERNKARASLAEAARMIPCAGPLPHRVSDAARLRHRYVLDALRAALSTSTGETGAARALIDLIPPADRVPKHQGEG